MCNKGNYNCKVNDLNNQGLINIYEESDSEKSKLKLKTVENNLYKLQNIMFFYLPGTLFAFVNVRWLVCHIWYIL